MYLLIALLACGGDDTTQPTDTPKIEANNTPDAGNGPSGGPGGDMPNNGQPQGNMGGQMSGDQGQGGPGGEGQMGGPGGEGQMGGPGGEGQMGGPGGPGGEGQNIGAAVPPEDGENIGDPNIPPDTINETIGKDGQAPQPMEMGNADGGQQEPKKKPPTFIFNAQSEDSGPIYKNADGSCFVRTNWDQPNDGTMGDTEARDCPPQMSSDAWENCPNGRLVKHNVGDKEGTCECQPIERGEAKVIDCP